jgi:hypothetical protein
MLSTGRRLESSGEWGLSHARSLHENVKKISKTKEVSVDHVSTDEVTCIARTTVREVVRTKDAEVHAAAGVYSYPFMHLVVITRLFSMERQEAWAITCTAVHISSVEIRKNMIQFTSLVLAPI